jgi:CRP-like cAMP-binding protein
MKSSTIEQARCVTEKCYPCHIRKFALFADLQQDDFNQLHLPIEDFELQAGDSLYTETDVPKYVYTIRSGLIKLVHFLPNGSYRIVRLLHKGGLAGIESLSGSHYLQHAIALQNTEICRISAEEIEHLNHKSPHLYNQLMILWQRAQVDADLWLSQFTADSSRKRVASLLLYLAENSTEEYFYLPGREDIGALLSITATTSSRIIAELIRHSFLQTKEHNAAINKAKLEQFFRS